MHKKKKAMNINKIYRIPNEEFEGCQCICKTFLQKNGIIKTPFIVQVTGFSFNLFSQNILLL